MTDAAVEKELEWVDKRFIKSFARIRYLCMIDKGSVTGYDVIRTAKDHLGIRLSTAAVYPVLAELEGDGYIVGSWETGKHQSKKKYVITSRGRKVLFALRKRIGVLVRELTSNRANA